MSDAAEQYVKALTHPKVKGGARALLDAIAQLIPDGETTTPAIAIEDLAAKARQHRTTVWRHLPTLEGIGEIKVLDGDHSKPASYHLVHLTGAQPLTTAPLPLVGATPPRRPKKTPTEATPSLFDHSAEGAPRSGAVEPMLQIATSSQTMLQIATSWLGGVLKVLKIVLQIATRSVKRCCTLQRGRRAHLDLDLLDLDLEREVVDRARARGAPDFLDWWVATLLSPAPPWHVKTPRPVDRLRDGPLIRELLDRPIAFDNLQTLAALYWQIRSDGVTDSDWDWIAKSDHSITVFHRKIEFLVEERARLAAARETPAEDDVWQRILPRIEAKVTRHEFYTWFRSSALWHDGGDVIHVAGDTNDLAWVEKHHRAIVLEATHEVRPGARVEFIAIDVEDRKSG